MSNNDDCNGENYQEAFENSYNTSSSEEGIYTFMNILMYIFTHDM